MRVTYFKIDNQLIFSVCLSSNKYIEQFKQVSVKVCKWKDDRYDMIVLASKYPVFSN